MNQRHLHRALSFSLAVVLTLGVLGGINTLSQPDAAAMRMAQQASAHRA